MSNRTFTPNSYFDDLTVGDHYATSGRTVTESDLVAFSGLSGDFSQLHTDEAYASATQFGGRIAHGALIISISTGLEYRIMGDAQDRIVAFYGMERVRFHRPVFIGDTVHVTGEVADLEVKDDDRGIVTIEQAVINNDGDTCATWSKRILNKRRPDRP